MWISRKQDYSNEGESSVINYSSEGEPSADPNTRKWPVLQECEKVYTRQNATLHPDPPLNDTTVPTQDSSVIDHMAHLPTEVTIPSLTAPTSFDANPTELDDPTPRRYPLRDRKEPDKLSFSKSSSNVAYPISDFVSYHRLSKSHLAFAHQLSSVPIPSHFQEALEDPNWKSAMVEEMHTLEKNFT